MRTGSRFLTVLFVSFALLAACKKGESTGASAEPPAATEGWDKSHVSRYTVRGEVIRLPIEGAHAAEMVIRHEEIPDFKGAGGDVVGMKAMAMPFPIKQGLSLAGIEPGDKVRFSFAMDWQNNRYQLESIEKLPAETELQFGPARE